MTSALTVHERLLARTAGPVAVLVALGALAVGIGLTTWLLLVTAGQVLATDSVLWLGALAAGYAVLAALLPLSLWLRWAPGGPRGRPGSGGQTSRPAAQHRRKASPSTGTSRTRTPVAW